MNFKIDVQYKTDIGNFRENNEDNFKVILKDEFACLAVCDGMGGHNAGEIASSLAVKYLEDFIYQKGDFAITWKGEENPTSPSNLFSDESLIDFIKKVNSKIHKESIINNSFKGMGTTFNGVFIFDNLMKILNVGDSRTYLIRNKKILRLTKDHSLLQQEVDKGTPENEAEKLIPKNIITRALGIKEDVEPDLYKYELNIGDRIILTTDGVHDLLKDDEILKIARRGKLEIVVNRIVEKAKRKGGFDNITVIVAEIKKWGKWWLEGF